LSRDLQPIHTKNFVNRLHLVLHICVKIFDVTSGKNLNRALLLEVTCPYHPVGPIYLCCADAACDAHVFSINQIFLSSDVNGSKFIGFCHSKSKPMKNS